MSLPGRLDKDRNLKAVLVATKTDLPSQRHAVSLGVAEDWAVANGMEFFATSSVGGAFNCGLGVGGSEMVLTSLPQNAHAVQLPPGTNVDAAFVAIAKAFHKSYEEKVTAYTDACRNY